MRLQDLDFDLPPELVAQTPAEPRESARLLHLQRSTGALEHASMRDFPGFLREGDLLVFNDTRVLRARLIGQRQSGGRVEALLLEEQSPNRWRALLKPSSRLKVGERVRFDSVEAVLSERDGAQWTLEFQVEAGRDVREWLPQIGQVPLPPYIQTPASEERYQTTFARADSRIEGRALDSAAAPTAGLHFSPWLFERLLERGVSWTFVTLAVGTGTFAPVKVENLDDHVMHAERYFVSDEAAKHINEQKARGARVVAIGTTSVRTLESAARTNGEVRSGEVRSGWGETRLFLRPGARFQMVDALLTNFHLPRSTLLALVAAFVEEGLSEQQGEFENGENGSNSHGLTLLRATYREAITHRYRFFSFGDALFLE
jgi:S-adenosylmethionine:tRNA ribosyltransferase-isomerase